MSLAATGEGELRQRFRPEEKSNRRQQLPPFDLTGDPCRETEGLGPSVLLREGKKGEVGNEREVGSLCCCGASPEALVPSLSHRATERGSMASVRSLLTTRERERGVVGVGMLVASSR